jgi:RNA-directed DNA polymerase
LTQSINPVIRGWGNYYCRSHVRKRFHQLDGWIIRRLCVKSLAIVTP